MRVAPAARDVRDGAALHEQVNSLAHRATHARCALRVAEHGSASAAYQVRHPLLSLRLWLLPDRRYPRAHRAADVGRAPRVPKERPAVVANELILLRVAVPRPASPVHAARLQRLGDGSQRYRPRDELGSRGRVAVPCVRTRERARCRAKRGDDEPCNDEAGDPLSVPAFWRACGRRKRPCACSRA